MTEHTDRGPRCVYIWGIIAFAAVFGLWLVTPFVMRILLPELEQRGQAGDLFGSISALFSGLAFAGVIIAILLQREELSLQRKELRLTRSELRRSASAQEKAHKALRATMYAQVFKVALDFLDSDEALKARDIILARQVDLTLPFVGVQAKILRSAETVVRSFEAVAFFVRRGLIPVDYITSSRSVSITEYWRILQAFVETSRLDRNDPYFGQDFEWLASEAGYYLSDNPPGPPTS